MLNQFLSIVAAEPGAAALIDAGSGVVTTRGELLARADALATRFADAHLREGELVAIQLPNSVDFVAAFAAALKLRLVAVPIDRDAPESEVGAILQHFGVRALVYRNGSIGPHLSTRHVDGLPSLPPETRLLKLTSGSTGKPKGIATSEANL